ncbi:MAG TPA: enoyl-CoA hydratase-related protein, partial [Solirubrobacteraceae bacterium]
MELETVRYGVAESGVATIALDQPDSRNALSDAVLGDLITAFTAARDDAAVRCVVLAGAGGNFCSGGDV